MAKCQMNASKNLINTQLTTQKALKNTGEIQVYNDETEDVIDIEDLKKVNFSYGGAFPYITNALTRLCTENPKIGDFYVIQRQFDESETMYLTRFKWSTLVFYATENIPEAKDDFRHEIMKIYQNPPSLYIRTQKGGILTHPIIITSIEFTDAKRMTPKEAELCSRLGITKKIETIEIEFRKDLFRATLIRNEQEGYIPIDFAFYAKLKRTIADINKDPILSTAFQRFYNPKTNEVLTKFPVVYYKFILYFLMHLSENDKTDTTTIDALEMLSHVDPGQLYERNGKNYIKNKFDTKLFLDKAGKLYNIMAQKGYCENTKGVINYCTYDDSNFFTIHYKKDRPRTAIPNYTSNFITENIYKNEPKTLEELTTNKNKSWL